MWGGGGAGAGKVRHLNTLCLNTMWNGISVVEVLRNVPILVKIEERCLYSTIQN